MKIDELMKSWNEAATSYNSKECLKRILKQQQQHQHQHQQQQHQHQHQQQHQH